MFECDFLHSLIIMSDYWYAAINYMIPCRPIYLIIRKLYLVCLHILLLAVPHCVPQIDIMQNCIHSYKFQQFLNLLRIHMSAFPLFHSVNGFGCWHGGISVLFNFGFFITNNNIWHSKNILIRQDINNWMEYGKG